MIETGRKPLAHLERLEIRRTFCFTESEDRDWQNGAVDSGIDFSSYIRDCVRIGHSIRQAERMRNKRPA